MSEVTYPRRAVVTGAASGIGKATAILLRERGSEVVAVDINEAGLADAAGAGAETVACNLATSEGAPAYMRSPAKSTGSSTPLGSSASSPWRTSPTRSTGPDLRT